MTRLASPSPKSVTDMNCKGLIRSVTFTDVIGNVNYISDSIICLIICHLPHGPTAYFTISDLVMRHDIPNIGNMSEAYPNLIFHNLETRLGERVRKLNDSIT